MLRRTCLGVSGMILGLLAFAMPVWAADAGNVALRFQYKPVDGKWNVSLLMENDQTLGVLQTKIQGVPSVEAVETTSRTSGVSLTTKTSEPGKLGILILAIGGISTEKSGQSILTIRLASGGALPSFSLDSGFKNRAYDITGVNYSVPSLLSPAPTMVGISPNTGSTAGGDTVEVSGYHYLPGGGRPVGQSCLWDPAGVDG